MSDDKLSDQQNIEEITLCYRSNHDVQWLLSQLAEQTRRAAQRERELTAAVAEVAHEYDELAADWHRYGGSSRKAHRAPWQDCMDDACVEHRRFVARLVALNLQSALAAASSAAQADEQGWA
jgi:hypothetical protein